MAMQNCYSGETTVSDLFSEISPAYVTLVHSALKKLAGFNFSFAKVVNISWHETFSKLSSAQSKHFLQNLFPSYLRKVKNLMQLIDPKLVPELPSKCQPPSTGALANNSTAKNSKPTNEKFNCSLSMFVELQANFIDSFFISLDCNLLSNEALQDLTQLDNAEYHIIAYCLYAARMWSSLPIQHVECFNRSCSEVAKLLKMALDSPTMAAFKTLTKSPKIPTVNNSQTTNLARLFVSAFEGMVSAVVDLKSKQNHLLQLGKLREGYLSGYNNNEMKEGANFFEGVCDGDNNAGRKSSLPSSLLRTLGLDGISTPSASSPQPTVPSLDYSAVRAMKMAEAQEQRKSTRRSSSNMVTPQNSRRASVAAVDCSAEQAVDNVFDPVVEDDTPSHAVRTADHGGNNYRRQSTAVENNGTNKAHQSVHSIEEAAVRTLEEQLTISEAQLNACRAELACEMAKHDALERHVEALNLLLKIHIDKCSDDGDGGPKYFIAAASPVEELKARIEQLLSWNESVMKKCKTVEMQLVQSQVAIAAAAAAATDAKNEDCHRDGGSSGDVNEQELQRQLEDLKNDLARETAENNRQEEECQMSLLDVPKIHVGRSKSRSREQSNVEIRRSSDLSASSTDLRIYRTVMCCPFGGSDDAGKCPISRHPGTFVCVPVDVRCHNKNCICSICRTNRKNVNKHALH